jgi:uncharacterized repeat protein (TIGR03803 family)
MQHASFAVRTVHWLVKHAWVATLMLIALVTAPAQGQTFTTQYTFTGGDDGAFPCNPLVQGRDGNLYGFALEGGIHGSGTIFSMTTAGIFTLIASLTGSENIPADYSNHYTPFPQSGLVQAGDGNLYGTTTFGGLGAGAIYRITTSGVVTQLYSFTDGLDGAYPFSGLIQATDGNLYGTTWGSYVEDGSGVGTIYRITTDGTFTLLHTFSGTVDGSEPYAALTQGTDGALYGTAVFGGASGKGTIFRITTSGVFSVLYSFTNGSDGEYPYPGLVQASDGNFYGVTWSGTIYRVTTGGTFTALSNVGTDGIRSTLVQANDGNLYGTTYFGDGTIFQVTLGGECNTVYTFTGESDGSVPYSGLVRGIDGNLYGTAYAGGVGNGTIYRLSVQQEPAPTISSFTPKSGFPGTSVIITGTNLSYATSVTFNGTPATITSDTATQIVATVPSGATTGPISVTTLGGTVTTTSNFTVVTLQSVKVSPNLTCPGLQTAVILTFSAPTPTAVTITASSSNSTVFPVPSTFTFPANQTSATLVKQTPHSVSAGTPITLTATLGGTAVTGTFNVVPWVQSVSVSPATVVAGGGAVMTINLAAAAPSGGLAVNVSSSNTDASPTDASGNPLKSITVAAGATSATVNITTYTSASKHTATLSAGNHGATQTCTLAINAGSVKLSVSPSTVISGSVTTFGLVTLGAAAPPQGTVVTLTSSSSAASVPASITVPSGSKSASFVITTSLVSAATGASISATAGTITATATLTLKPVIVSSVTLYPSLLIGGDNAIGIVTLPVAAPSAITVTLSSSNSGVALPDQTVTIPAGATASVFNVSTFAVTTATTVTITATLNGASQATTMTVSP